MLNFCKVIKYFIYNKNSFQPVVLKTFVGIELIIVFYIVSLQNVFVSNYLGKLLFCKKIHI